MANDRARTSIEQAAGATVDVLIGTRFRTERARLDHTQDEVATAMRHGGYRWSGVTVAQVESGKRPLRWSEVLWLNHSLGFQLDKLTPHTEPSNSAAVDLQAAGEVERRAAARLGITTVELEKRSKKAWGAPFAFERRRRAIGQSMATSGSVDRLGRGAMSKITGRMLDELAAPPTRGGGDT